MMTYMSLNVGEDTIKSTSSSEQLHGSGSQPVQQENVSSKAKYSNLLGANILIKYIIVSDFCRASSSSKCIY